MAGESSRKPTYPSGKDDLSGERKRPEGGSKTLELVGIRLEPWAGP